MVADNFTNVNIGERHNCEPIYYNGDTYILLQDSADNSILEIYSSPTGLGGTWTEIASINTSSSSTVRSVAWVLNGDNLCIVIMDTGDDVNYSEYDISADTWVSSDVQLINGSQVSSNDHSADIDKYANGDLIIVYQADNVSSQHSTAFIERLSGTWDTTGTTIDDGVASTDYTMPHVWVDSVDVANIAYYDETNGDILIKTWDGTTLSSVQTVNDTTVTIAQTGLNIYGYQIGSVERAVVIWIKSAANGIGFSFVDDGGTPSAEHLTTLVAATNNILHVSADNTNDEVIAVVADSSDDLWLIKYDGSVWTETEIGDAYTAKVGGLGVFANDDSDIVAAYIYSNGTASEVDYDEYVLPAALSVSLTFISSASSVYAVTETSTIAPSFISSSSSVYALTATATLSVSLGFISSSSAVYSPTITSTIALGFISSSSVLYTPTVTVEPQVNLNFISSSSVLYTPSPESTVTLGFISSSSSVYVLTATAVLSVSLGFISSISNVYALTPKSTIALSFISSSSTVYALVASEEPQANLGFIASSSTVYSLTASPDLDITLTFISSSSVVYAISATAVSSDTIEYESTLLDYELYSDDLADYELYSETLLDYQLYDESLADYQLYNNSVAIYELYSSDLEDNMPVQDGTIAKKLTLTLGDDHTGSYTAPDTVTFYLEYPNSAPIAYVNGTDSEVSNPSSGVYVFKILASQEGAAYVQAKAVWIAESWTEITSKQKLTIERFIGA